MVDPPCAVEGDQTVELPGHVGVVGMGLIDDENLAGETNEAHRLVARRQNGE